MNKVTVKEVEQIAFLLARRLFSFDETIPDFGTRYPHILESCLSTPFQTFAGRHLYPSFISKVAILFYLMTKNHPFQNGNKRIAMTTLLYLLYTEHKWIEVETQVLYNFAVWVAQSPPDAKPQVVEYIRQFLKNNIVAKNN
ncbi:MAG: Fic family protein [Syntrophaceae bacterium]|nr:Fic family protein [Syntrophaceae bacterium]